MNALAVNARDRGELAAASLLFERCVAIWKDLGDSADIARALSNLASVMKLQGDYTRASSLYDECLTMFRKAGDGAGVAWTLNYQGDVARERADFVAARSFCEQSLAAFRQLRDGWGIASALSDLAALSCDQGNDAEARRLLRRKHPDVSGVGPQTRNCPRARMSRRQRCGAIEGRAIAASGRSRRRASSAIGRAAYAG